MNVVNGGLEHAQSNAASVMCEFGGKFVLLLIGESLVLNIEKTSQN